MDWLLPLALIAAGIIAASAIIISKMPKAKDLIDKMAPIQGFLGVALLVIGVIKLIQLSSIMERVNAGPAGPMLTIWGSIASAVLLGFFLGMPLIAKWIPGDSPAEQKAMDMQKKIVPFQGVLGFIGIVCAVAYIYYNTKH